nr:hypothetical protein [Tanacetum cinerariifolium]
MASATRSAIFRTITSKSNPISKLLTPKSTPISPFHSSTRPITRSASRVVAALGSVESMMPLHSVIASARLRSSIAVDSTCWSFLSQGFASSL